MMYLISILLSVGIIVLTIYSERKPNKCLDLLNVALFILGIALIVFTIVSAHAAITTDSYSLTLVEWAQNILSVWFTYTGIAVAFIFVLIFLSLCVSNLSLKIKTSNKSQYPAKLRIWLSTIASLLIIFSFSLYSALASHEGISTASYVIVSGIGFALLFRIFSPLEHLLQKRKNSQ